MEEEICKYNQKGYCKYGSECHKYHRNEICKVQNCSSKSCRERHPTFCRYFKENGICKFGLGCAYVHVKMVNTDEVNVLTVEIKNMKTEMDSLKSTVNSLVDIKKEGKVITKMIDSLHEAIKDIKQQN